MWHAQTKSEWVCLNLTDKKKGKRKEERMKNKRETSKTERTHKKETEITHKKETERKGNNRDRQNQRSISVRQQKKQIHRQTNSPIDN
jgi:hypothetical protein